LVADLLLPTLSEPPQLPSIPAPFKVVLHYCLARLRGSQNIEHRIKGGSAHFIRRSMARRSLATLFLEVRLAAEEPMRHVPTLTKRRLGSLMSANKAQEIIKRAMADRDGR
jgi:hypothetical protein